MRTKNVLFNSDIHNDRHLDLSKGYVDNNNHYKAAYIFKFVKENQNNENINNIVYKDAYSSNKTFLERYFLGSPYSKNNSNDIIDTQYIFSEYMANDISNPFSSLNLNKYLRNYGGWKNDVEERIFRLNSFIERFPLKEDLVVYRGFTLNSNSDLAHDLDQAYKYIYENHEPYGFVDMGFLSTTRDPMYAHFLAEYGNGNISVYMSIIAKKGVRCIPLCSEYGTTMNDMEKEIVFHAFSKYKIVGIERYEFLKRLHYDIILLAEPSL